MNIKQPDRQRSTGLREAARYSNWPTAYKLLAAMIGLSLIPLFLATLIGTAAAARAMTVQTDVSLSRLAHGVALDVSQQLASNHQVIQLAATDPDLIDYLSAPAGGRRAALQPNVNALIAILQKTDPSIGTMGVYDLSGKTVADSDPAKIGRNVSTYDFARAALAGQTFTSSLRHSPVDDSRAIDLSAPVIAGGRVVGAIGILVPGQALDDLVTQSVASYAGQNITAAQKQSLDVYLVDANGVVVSRPSQSAWLFRSLGTPAGAALAAVSAQGPLGAGCLAGSTSCAPGQATAHLRAVAVPGAQALGDQLRAALGSGGTGNFRYCSPSDLDAAAPAGGCAGSWHVIGYASVPNPSAAALAAPANLLMAVVDVPEEVYLAPVQALRWQGLVTAGAIGLLAVAVGLALAQSLTRPIRRLATTAQEVEADKPFDPGQISGVAALRNEIGELARVFSSMVMALRMRVAELRTLHDIGQTISSSIDLDQTLAFIVDSVRGAIPYDAAELCLYDEAQGCMVARMAAAQGPAQKTERAYGPDEPLIAGLLQGTGAVLVPEIAGPAAPETPPGRTWAALAPCAYLGIALRSGEGIVGTLELVSRQPGGFTMDNLRILESLAVQAALAIRNAEQVRSREMQLKQQIAALSIQIDEIRREKEVHEIVDNEDFQRIREKAAALRGARRGGSPASGA